MVRSSAPPTLELTLLGILERTPMHGYNLFKAVCALDGFGLIWKVKQSYLYALLDKLAAQGLLRSDLLPGETHPARREFQVTDQGRRTLQEWMSTPVDSIRNMRQDFFARLYFARQAGPDQALDLVRAQRSACQLWLQDIQRKLDPAGDAGDYTRVVLGHRKHIVKATLAWMDEYERNHQ